MNDEPTRDIFDRAIGLIDGTPGTQKARPTTVTSVQPILGDAQTYVIQSYKTEDGFYGFVQMVDRSGGARFVLPPKVMAAIYRQRESLVKASRSSRAKDRWADLSAEERAAKVAHLRPHRKTASA